ncbi:ficolin-3-like [Asterias rubens]|uniref:ficolin-3-like n=1 Tax=Asterias rubens TaxID=7604 RepID=UPI0014558498|nr:ficolin-3-like [Asterias rubens]
MCMRQMLISFALAQITLVVAVSAGVCYISTEPDESGRVRFVLPPEDPCSCTRIKIGGHNTVAPHRATPPAYLDSLPSDAKAFRQSHRCTEMTTTNADTTTVATTTPVAETTTVAITTHIPDTTTVSTTQELLKTATVTPFSDCQAILDAGYTKSGLYTVRITSADTGATTKVDVYCHMENNEGFIVIQRRYDGSVDFNRNWNEYKEGFGDLTGEFWWGNKNLRSFTEPGNSWKLRVSLHAFGGTNKTYDYGVFSIDGESYDLTVGDFRDRQEDDGLDSHRGAFSTADADNDGSGAKNCAAELNGGWWHKKCNTYDSFLNGVYSPTRPAALNKGIKWTPWTGLTDSLKGCEMMIRP